jgi:4-hydroxy-2-oxoheptanedioate aldolase
MEYGLWCMTPGAFHAEVLGTLGFDWCGIDLQHGMVTRADLMGMLQGLALSGTAAYVRVPWNDPPELMWALDAGATGVIVPMVEDAEQARAAVAACRYAPQGGRSWGPTRAALHGRRSPAELAAAARCVVMVETARAVQRLDEILAVPGVDGVFVGPNDLAISMGLAPGTGDDAHEAAIRLVAQRCIAHGVTPGIYGGDPATAARFRDFGYRFVALCSDVWLIGDAAKRALAVVKTG